MKKKVFLILTVLWTLFIFFNSSLVGNDSAEMSGVFARLAKAVLNFIGLAGISSDVVSFAVRKAAHFTEFFIQSILFSAFLSEGRKRYSDIIIYILFCGLLTACCDEFLQMFIDGRGSSVRDVFVDFSGTVCAVGVFAAVRRIKAAETDK